MCSCVAEIDLQIWIGCKTNLRCHPVGCADGGVLATQRGRSVGGDAVVDQLDVGVLREQNVVAFDVAMHAVVAVQVN